ncbi:GNAT family N-acetyltransferase [Sphingobium nicotianae]|uniref:GNAT family N-acetyltransferase n=1 Tax=Sphingobium nicotianae TaxID=2782607 RepID=A0A9X1IRT9_9SPHN|nr:GNAT family N-acetyltransferase [Sphingobium nicotianae]MBT2187485.1 GNAT family N-acetyltransferase [Sphingobium nicotianae]
MTEIDDRGRRDGPRPDALVRRMRRSDVELLQEIHTLCLRECLTSHYNPSQIEALLEGRTPLDYWLASERGERFAVVEVAEIVAGYASWREGELLSTFVAPVAQAHRLGTFLFEACAREAAKEGMPIDRVRATLNATSFFQSLGFRPVEAGYDEKNGIRIPHMLMRCPTEQTAS